MTVRNRADGREAAAGHRSRGAAVRRSLAGIAAGALLLAAWAAAPARAQGRVKPQAGFEFYGGANALTQLTPWVALRFSLSPTTSLIARYHNHNLQYDYAWWDETSDGPVTKTRRATLSNFTGVLYHQKGRLTAWGAGSLFMGTDGYRATALDAGVGLRVLNRLAVETGLYLLREDSILWFPEEARRKINLYSWKSALRIKLTPWLTFNPNVYLYRNSEDVSAASWSAGFVFTPVHPFYLTVYYFRYSERSAYRFAGDYVSAGINIYY